MSGNGAILVTGAAGQLGGVGRAVVGLLLGRGLPVRALVRREDDRAAALRAEGAEVVVGDLLEPADVYRAASGTRRVYFGMSVSAGYLEATVTMAAVAREVGVDALVNMSQMTVSEMDLHNTSPSRQQRQHWLGEQALLWSGLPVVTVRPTIFLDTFLTLAGTSVRERGRIELPFGLGKTNPVAAADVARVVAAILADPAPHLGRIYEAIAAERAALAPVRERATDVWDTSGLSLRALAARIASTFGSQADDRRMHVGLVAFGYKHGIPLDADLVLDVRFLPNPHYVEELRELTGLAQEVRAYLEAQPKTAQALERLYAFLDYVLPLYAAEARTSVTIAVGCTGGVHRSVYAASKIGEHLAADGRYQVTTTYRDAGS